MISVAVLGHGVVGSGVAEILLQRRQWLQERTGQDIVLRRILDLRSFDSLPYADLFTKDIEDILGDPEISIVAECMGGSEPAHTFLKRAILSGKHVLTSNKEMVATHGEELCRLAAENNVFFLYEASTGGGIPALTPIHNCLTVNSIDRITGILNGTTNYILTRMRDGGVSFDTALKEAQQNGYAEANPEADVKGYDARRKLCILAHVGFGAPFDDGSIPTTGIDELTREDMLYARELDRSIKLIAMCERDGGGWVGHVCPTMLPSSHPLSAVNDVFNAVMVHGDFVEDVMFYGRGAGKFPTASAMLSDIVQIATSGRPLIPDLSLNVPYLGAIRRPVRLFVRVPQGGTEAEALVSQYLPGALIVRMEKPVDDSFAFVTEQRPETELRAALALLGEKLPLGMPIRYETM